MSDLKSKLPDLKELGQIAGKLFKDMGLPPLSQLQDRVMLCGSPGMLNDLKLMLEARGFVEGNTSTPGDFVIERAFVEK